MLVSGRVPSQKPSTKRREQIGNFEKKNLMKPAAGSTGLNQVAIPQDLMLGFPHASPNGFQRVSPEFHF